MSNSWTWLAVILASSIFWYQVGHDEAERLASIEITKHEQSKLLCEAQLAINFEEQAKANELREQVIAAIYGE